MTNAPTASCRAHTVQYRNSLPFTPASLYFVARLHRASAETMRLGSLLSPPAKGPSTPKALLLRRSLSSGPPWFGSSRKSDSLLSSVCRTSPDAPSFCFCSSPDSLRTAVELDLPSRAGSLPSPVCRMSPAASFCYWWSSPDSLLTAVGFNLLPMAL